MGLCSNKDIDTTVQQLENVTPYVTYLIGDIGGTNARFQLKKVNPKQKSDRQMLKEAKLETQKYPSLIKCLQEFLKEFSGTKDYPAFFCMGIAGPSKSKVIKITNADWPEFNVDDVQEVMKFQNIKILNDFEANAYGVLAMDKTHYQMLNSNPIQDGSPKALIGAGTGLGECLLTKGKGSKNYEVFPCEGGYADYAPRNDFEFGYMQFIKSELGNIDRVSIERCVAGPAIPLLFKYLKSILPDVPTSITSSNPGNTEIMAALEKKDPLCERVIEEFLAMYGTEAGNLALKILPYGGLYLLSGLTQALKKKILEEKTFISNFLRKGRMSSLLEKIPIFIVDENIGLIGAEEAALRLI
jgi:glucokinase